MNLIKEIHDELSDQIRAVTFRLDSLIGDESLGSELRSGIRELYAQLETLIDILRKELILADGRTPSVFSIEVRRLITLSLASVKSIKDFNQSRAIALEIEELLTLPKDFLESSKAKFKPQVALTVREKDVLKLLPNGLTAKEMALSLFLTEATIKSHLASLYRKLEVGNRVQAIAVAIESGLIKSK